MVRLFVLLSIGLIPSCRFLRMAAIQMPGQHDFRWQEYVVVKNDSLNPFHFYDQSLQRQNQFLSQVVRFNQKPGDTAALEAVLQKNKVAAFVMIRKDTILCERYFKDYKPERYFTSFSVAKSFTSTLTGIAIDEGAISSIEDPVVKYIPELEGKKWAEELKIIHLLEHTSGIRFREIPYNPVGRMTALYHRRHQEGSLPHLRFDRKPGNQYEYQDVNTYLLGLLTERAVGKPLQDYLSEKVWKPLGMEADAQWSTDRKGGRVRTFCCLQTKVKDLARFGRLFLHQGNWNGQQVLSKEWVTRATWCDGETDPNKLRPRPFQWQTGGYPDCDFNARGLYDQFIYVHPRTQTIIVMISDKHYFTRVAWREMFRVMVGL